MPQPESRRFAQIDVFSSTPLLGNPVAVVVDGDGLTSEEMARFARWTNLSETTFLLPPTTPDADYRVRIFTPGTELPFAGHPTLGSAHAWLSAGGTPRRPGVVVQECEAGLVDVRDDQGLLAFGAPPTLRSGPLDPDYLTAATDALGIDLDRVVAHQWVDNGSGWAAIELSTADEVLALEPDFSRFPTAVLGVVGAHPAGSVSDFEVRGFPVGLGIAEDPVTGSLNAAIAQWLIRTGKAEGAYTASQGARVGRQGLIHVSTDPDGTTWIGGTTTTLVSGTVVL